MQVKISGANDIMGPMVSLPKFTKSSLPISQNVAIFGEKIFKEVFS